MTTYEVFNSQSSEDKMKIKSAGRNTDRQINGETDQKQYTPKLWSWVRMNRNNTYLSALGLAGAANNASSASSSNRLLLDGLGLALLVTLLTPADLDRELMEVTDWLDLTLPALGFSSSDQLSSYQKRRKWCFKIQKITHLYTTCFKYPYCSLTLLEWNSYLVWLKYQY